MKLKFSNTRIICWIFLIVELIFDPVFSQSNNVSDYISNELQTTELNNNQFECSIKTVAKIDLYNFNIELFKPSFVYYINKTKAKQKQDLQKEEAILQKISISISKKESFCLKYSITGKNADSSIRINSIEYIYFYYNGNDFYFSTNPSEFLGKYDYNKQKTIDTSDFEIFSKVESVKKITRIEGGNINRDGTTFTVTGTCEFRDINDNLVPIRYAKVKIGVTGFNNDVVTHTDAFGEYSKTITITVSSPDITVKVYTVGVTGEPIGSDGITDLEKDVLFGSTFYMEETEEDVTSNIQIDIFELTGNTDLGAFAIFDSFVEGWVETNSQLNVQLDKIESRWPSSSGSYYTWPFWFFGNKIHILQGHEFERDVILHEYGHYIDQEFDLFEGYGGDHFLCTNMTGQSTGSSIPPYSYSREHAVQLALSEGWASFYSVKIQFNNTGDVYYRSNNSLEEVFGCKDADNESAVFGVLWDICDNNEESFDKLNESFSSFWTLLNSGSKLDSIQNLADLWISEGKDNTPKLYKIYEYFEIDVDWNDITGPDITIINPDDNETVSGSVSIDLLVEDDISGVSFIEIYIDNDPKYLFYQESDDYTYNYIWNTYLYDNSTHDIRVEAEDNEGNITSEEITVTVSNTVPPTSIAVTTTLTPSTVPGNSIVSVSGNAIYDTGDPVSAATVTISTSEASWTTTMDANGNYNQSINAPYSSGYVTVYIFDGILTGSAQDYITIQSGGGEDNYDYNRSTICEDVDDDDPWDPINETRHVRSDFENVFCWTHLENLYVSVKEKWEWYKPNGSLLGTGYSGWTDDPQDFGYDYYSWWKLNLGWTVNGTDLSDMEGRHNVDIYIKEEGGSYEYIDSQWWVMSYDYKEHRMCKDVQDNDPWDPINPTSTFFQTDPKAYTWSKYDDVSEDIESKIEWYEPNGSLYTTTTYTHPDPGVGYYYQWVKKWFSIGIDNYSAENKCGEWELKHYEKDPFNNWDLLYVDNFLILESPNIVPVTLTEISPLEPLANQDITITISATDNTYLDQVILYWDDGTLQSHTWDGILSSSFSNSISIGNYNEGDEIEVYGKGFDTSGNESESTHTIITIPDNDTDGPIITNLSIEEYNGNGNGLIEYYEQVKISCCFSDESGLGTVSFFVDNVDVSIPNNFHAVCGPFYGGNHVVTITAQDNDNSPESTTISSNFDVSFPEFVVPFYETWESYAGSTQIDWEIINTSQFKWKFDTDNQNYGRVRWGTDAHQFNEGLGAITLDNTTVGINTVNYLILTLNLSSVDTGNLLLSFQYADHDDNSDPNDKVWVRGNQDDDWIEVYNLDPGNIPNDSFQSVYGLDITSILSSATPQQYFSNTFQLRIGQEGINATPIGGISFDNIILSNSSSQSINHDLGWNVISFNLRPDHLHTDSIFKTMMDSSILVKVIDENAGSIHYDAGSGWVNTIGSMYNSEGYYMKVSENYTLSTGGVFLKSPFDIALTTGWNILGYPLRDTSNALDILQPLIDSLYLIKVVDESGNFIQNIPGIGWMNTIGQFKPGKGYYVKVNTNCSLRLGVEKLSITTAYNDSITQTSFVGGGYVTANGGAVVTDRGVCWSISQNPTLSNSYTTNGSGIGSFVSNLTGLTPNTEYFVRAYATNSLGTEYGQVISVTTNSTIWQCGDLLIDVRDGKKYNTIQIGSECWMAENINIGSMIIGTEEMSDNSIIEKYCYDNSTCNCDEYGGLYQLDEMMAYPTDNSKQGICPEGWHIPTDEEWKTLEGTVDSQYPVEDPIWDNFGWRGFDVGLNLKSSSGWYSDGDGTNAYGFNAYPGGVRNYDSTFLLIGEHASFWSSVDAFDNNNFTRHLNYNNDNNYRGFTNDFGISVRCIKDTNVIVNQPPVHPYSPTPSDGSQNQMIEIELSWRCSDPEGDTLIFDMYFGTDSVPTLAASALTDTIYDSGILMNDTTYFWKVVVHDNQNNTTDGPVWSFTTEPWQCGNTLTDTRDGQTYNTVLIGTQCWMAENLNVGTMILGTQEPTNNSQIEKFCYLDDPSHCLDWGGLYKWDELMQYVTDTASQGICPEGWFVPTDNDWKILEGTTDSQFPIGDPIWNNQGFRGYDVGLNLKSTVGWGANYNNGTDLYDFSALPGGYWWGPGSNWYNGGWGAYFWTSTSCYTSTSWYRRLSYTVDEAFRDCHLKTHYSLSVRCLRY